MGTKVCFIPLVVTNRLNSSDVNCGPFTETRCSGIPFEEKHYRRHSIVFVEVVEVIGKNSIHFECESISSRNICLFFATKSLWTSCQTRVAHIQGCSCASGGICTVSQSFFLFFYVNIQPWTQHIANYFIRIMP